MFKCNFVPNIDMCHPYKRDNCFQWKFFWRHWSISLTVFAKSAQYHMRQQFMLHSTLDFIAYHSQIHTRNTHVICEYKFLLNLKHCIVLVIRLWLFSQLQYLIWLEKISAHNLASKLHFRRSDLKSLVPTSLQALSVSSIEELLFYQTVVCKRTRISLFLWMESQRKIWKKCWLLWLFLQGVGTFRSINYVVTSQQ